MAEYTGDGHHAGEKSASKSLMKKIRFYLQKMKSIENPTTLSLFEKTKQTLWILTTRMNVKNENDDKITQTLSKMTETMKKLNENGLWKKKCKKHWHHFCQCDEICGDDTINYNKTNITWNDDKQSTTSIERTDNYGACYE